MNHQKKQEDWIEDRVQHQMKDQNFTQQNNGNNATTKRNKQNLETSYYQK